MTSPPRHRAIVATSVLLVTGCSDLPKLEYETEHLELGAEFPLCRGNLDHYEHVVTTLETALDTTLDKKVKVYIWDMRENDDPGWCDNDDVGGCYADREIFSEVHSVEHELVHALIDSFGSPSTFWSEGAAEAMQVGRTRFGTRDPATDVDKTLPDDISYTTAGHFSRWLLETYGIDQYQQLLRSPKAGRAAFESVYGVAFEDAQSDYFEQAADSYRAYISCDDLPLAQIDSQNWSESIEIECTEPSTYGGINGLYSSRVVTIAERGDYSISTSATQMSIIRCPDGDYDEPPSLDDPQQYGDIPEYTDVWLDGYVRVLEGSGEVHTFDLTPGRYRIAMSFESFEPNTATLDISAPPAP